MPNRMNTTFTSPDWTLVRSTCDTCGDTIVEAVPLPVRRARRIACCECLAKWFERELKERRAKRGNAGRGPSPPGVLG